MGEMATRGHEARQEKTTMIRFEAMEPERLAFLSELYTQSAGDARQGVPYEALIHALGFEERVTKRLQCALQQEGLVELTTVPPMTHIRRPVMDHAHRHRSQQTISLTPQGVRLLEDILAKLHPAPPQTPAAPDQNTTV
jgi:hypothetical protein